MLDGVHDVPEGRGDRTVSTRYVLCTHCNLLVVAGVAY